MSAREFVRNWLPARTSMQNTGHTSKFGSLSDGCTNCRALVDTTDDVYGAGGFIRTNGWIPVGMAFRRLPHQFVEVTLSVRGEQVRYALERSGEVRTMALEPQKHLLIVRRVNDHWRATFVGPRW